ncbi:MAG: class C sortase [Clostridia bacterium]|nr:class C sortase [Clostridia bacterium]
MKKRIKKVIGNSLILIGIIIIVIPFIFRLITTLKVNRDVAKFEKEVKNFKIEDNNESKSVNLEELRKVMEKYNQDLLTNGQEISDPFSFQKLDFDMRSYGIENNIVAEIKIDRLKLKVPVYLGATEENLNKGLAHLSHTSLPLGEETSNVVIAGHRGLIRHKMFRHLDKLEQGDEVVITNFWEELRYKVIKYEIISPEEVSKVLIQNGKDMITLITCHPFRVNTQRLVVYCERI